MHQKEMTRERAIEELRKQQTECDTEVAHGEADAVLCDLLISLGFSDVVDEYHKVEKWFA